MRYLRTTHPDHRCYRWSQLYTKGSAASLTQQNRQEHTEAECEKPERGGRCASRALEARLARGKARVEPHPVLMTIGKTTLAAQRFFQALLCFGRELCVRDFADFFRELARDLAHVIELLRVALAERAHEVMDAQLYPHHQRKFFIHP